MQTVRVPLIMTVADRKRAEAVKASEQEAKASKVPDFIRQGLAACGKVENADDFTDETRRGKSGYQARARAATLCGSCPFSGECLPWAKASKQTGVYGGEWLKSGEIVEGMIRYA